MGEGSSLGETYNGISPEDELPNNMLADLFLAQSLDVYTIELAPSTVPIPVSIWLFGSSLLGLIGIAKRKQIS